MASLQERWTCRLSTNDGCKQRARNVARGSASRGVLLIVGFVHLKASQVDQLGFANDLISWIPDFTS